MTMNIILKELCNQLAWYEHPQSLTQREMAIASYLVVSLVINMALLPLFVVANISEFRALPWLFKGDHKDVAGPWYGEFSKKFMEIAFLNAVSSPSRSSPPSCCGSCKCGSSPTRSSPSAS